MPITARLRRIRLSSRHGPINHGRLQVTQINKQAVQLLKEVDEPCIMRIMDIQIVPEAALNKDVG